MTDLTAWTDYFREAESALTDAIEHQTAVWLSEQQLSEGYLEAVEMTKRARMTWECRLVAYNAFCEAQA